MSNNFCSNCGSKIENNNSKFCSNCGAAVKPLEQQQQQPEQQRQQQKRVQTSENKSNGSGCLLAVIFFISQVINLCISYTIGKQTVKDKMTSSAANIIKYGLMSESEINNEIMAAALPPFLIILAISAIICALIGIVAKK